MKILALESSAKAASAAVMEDGVFLAQYYQACGLTHSRTLMAMAEHILADMELKIDDIDTIAVAAGPGSFTGIRIGVAAAKGLAWGADKPVCPVSTLEAMANQCFDSDVVICPVMDARRNQVYNALFEYSQGNLKRVCQDRAVSVDELINDAKNSTKQYLLIGDGAQMCYNKFSDAGVRARLAPENIRLQSAFGVARAASYMPAVDAADVEPNYLRLSQAERERLEKAKNK